MIRAASAAVLVMVLTSTAAAAPARVTLPEAGVSFAPPAGWSEAPVLARQVARAFVKEAELAGVPASKLRTGGRAWTSPPDAAQKGVLHVQWIVAETATPAAEVARVVRAELDDARERPRLTALPTTAYELVSWSEEAKGSLAWGQLESRHVANETRTLARTTMFVDAGGHLHEIRVECVMAEGEGAVIAGDPLAPRTGCAAAMTAVAVLAPAGLQPLGDVPGQGTLRVTGDQLVDADDPRVRPDGGLELRTPTPGAQAHVMPGTAPAPRLDRPQAAENRAFSRMLMVGGGVIVILALAFTMGRKRKPE